MRTRLAGAFFLCGTLALAQVVFPDAKPVPRMQATPLPDDQVSFERDGKEIARFHYGPQHERPFVYPVLGPSGWKLTRMGHPGDPHGHSHHNSVWITFHDLSGVNFWGDRGDMPLGRIVVEQVEKLDDGDEEASVTTLAVWRAEYGTVLLEERRRTAVVDLEDGEWMLILDVRLEAAAATGAIFEAERLGPIGVRVAKTISEQFGGGRLRNSEGAEGEPALFHKRARWVDYSGPVAQGVIEGLALMDHPDNPRHPAHFHVRRDGWMGALLTEEAPLRLEKGQAVELRYGLYVHRGAPSTDALDEVWNRFAARPR